MAFFWLLGIIRNVDFKRRAIVFLVLLYAMAFVEIYNYGYSADSFIFFMALVVIAALLLGHFGGLTAFLVAIITIGVFGISIGSGNFLPGNAYQGIPSPGTVQRAFTSLLIFSACAAALITAVTILIGSLNKAWQMETQALNLLQQERDLLDQRVTERTAELAEARDQAVQNSNELRKYFMAIEQSGSTIVITDTKGTIEYVNPRFEQSTGYTLLEAVGTNPRILKSGRQPDEYYAEMWNTISGGKVWNGEFLNKRKDGSLYWESATIAPVVDLAGQVTNYVAIKEDITARRHAEEELRKLSRAVEQSGNTVIIMDRNGLIEYVNPKFSEVTSYSPAEALGKSTAALMQGLNSPADFRNDEWWQTVNSGQLWNGEFQNRRKDGSIFWESATIAPVQDHDGQVTNFVEIKQDITQQKLLQAQLQKQNDYLSILHEITLDLLNRRDLSDLLQVIVDRSAVLLDAPFSELMLGKDDLLVVEAFTANQPELKRDRVTRDQAKLSWQAFDTHQPVTCEDYATWEHRREIHAAQQIHATADFPVMAGERCLGVLSLGRSQPGYTFDSEQIETGTLFARLVALVLDNANLYESARREIAERARAEAQNQAFLNDIKALQKVNLELSEVEDLNDLYIKMIDVCHHRMGIDRVALFVIDPESGDLCGTYGTDQSGGFRDERYYRETVGENHWTLDIANARNHTILWEDAPISDDGHEVGHGWKVATALWNGHRSIGHLVSDNFVTQRPLRSYEVELVSLLGSAFGHLIERKRAENLLLESEARFRQIVENASDIIYRTDAKGYFTYVNPTGLHAMGCSSEAEIIGRHYLDLVLPSMRQELRRSLQRQLLNRIMNTYQEFIAIAVDGREVWLGQNVQLILSGNEISGCQAVARDITQLKQAQEAIAISRDQALEASQLKTQLLSRVSHELRTPLSSVLGYAELLSAEAYGTLNGEQKVVTKRISDSSRYLTAIINDLLDEAQISSKNITLHNELFSLSTLLENVRARTTVLAQNKSIFLNTEIDPDLPQTLYGDEKRLQQIIINLVGNAIKFTKIGGVNVRLYTPSPSRWSIQVSDTGSGIPEEDQRYIFDAFRQVNNAITRENRGTGLGLSIVKQLVEIMDGSIQLVSKAGEGSTFTIILPILTPRETK
jgi:PAS domain S-box-containing protein